MNARRLHPSHATLVYHDRTSFATLLAKVELKVIFFIRHRSSIASETGLIMLLMRFQHDLSSATR